MKILFLILILFYSFDFKSQTDSLPELNEQIFLFVKSQIGKRVGRGECWDLAKIPLTKFNAKWDGKFDFGKELDWKKDKILPGDIIQFQNVQIEYQDGSRVIKESYPQHTAIIYQVISKNEYFVAQQNTETNGKKVSIDKLYFDKIRKGKILVYRPEK
ncbi:MAG: hypothetical protein HYU67_01290 [Flavobacteriia bacterium]|nr:hypothetical protein [Flavobacteriia bacterium]